MTLSHVDDVASMLAKVIANCFDGVYIVESGTWVLHQRFKATLDAQVPGNPAAIQQHFNVVTDRCISFDGIVKAVAVALGKEAKIVHYDPAKVGLPKGKGFPFRCSSIPAVWFAWYVQH